jgi:hypothetical protein
MDEIERWLPVPGYEGKYEVSDQGQVRSVEHIAHHRFGRGRFADKIITSRKPGRLLRPGIGSNGYPTVSLGGKSHTVHSLVLTAFVGPAPSGSECLHRNGIRADARLENLRWGTRAENCADMAIHGTRIRGESYSTAKLTNDAVRKIRRLRGVVPQSELARRFNVSPAAVQAVHDGRTWRHVV